MRLADFLIEIGVKNFREIIELDEEFLSEHCFLEFRDSDDIVLFEMNRSVALESIACNGCNCCRNTVADAKSICDDRRKNT